ncbi:gluconate 2-dehydrogenase subunit 3 family protein [Robbsia sp. KACC 23696]|uniref:gluconate 2-dehydrogenase subunit 3 family protein n=1 Tax=Robbsia sp. KACC 23696 TaxID=3149231 RepID=UPI00325B5F0E
MTQRETQYPGYDVLRKIATPSWDDASRRVVSDRMSVRSAPQFFDQAQSRTVMALCHCIVPQAEAPPEVPLAAMLDENLQKGIKDGFRNAQLPPPSEAWLLGLAALDAESEARWHRSFADLTQTQRIELLKSVQNGDVIHGAWEKIAPKLFFSARVLHDICGAYYSHPHAWSEIGFGGPANPRGYVRLYFDRRDPWEAVEVKKNGGVVAARLENGRVK